MINNIDNLNNNNLIEIDKLLKLCKTFVFKNKFVADNNETKVSLSNSSYYIKACMNPSANIPSNLPAYILNNLDGNTNQDIINLYVKNTYYSIKTNNIINDSYFAENNIYYRDLFINYYRTTISEHKGDLAEEYDYNISILSEYPSDLEKLLLYIFECRIYNHLDILYYNTNSNTINLNLSLFFDLYATNKNYFLKTIYTEGFEIQENYFNFCKFFVVFMTLQQFINKKMEIVFDLDLLDDYSIINLLYSYGIYFLDDLPIYYQKRVVKNIQRLLTNKGNNQVIANILDIFELPDDTVFKYYMEKKYVDNTPDNISFIGIPYNEYSYINYIDSGKTKTIRPFEDITRGDESWKTKKDFILNSSNKIDFDYIQSKYLSIKSSFEIQTFAAECAFFFDTIYRCKEYNNNIFTNDKILTSYSYEGFDVFDGIIALATLAMIYNGTEPIIFKSNYLNNRYAFRDNLILNENNHSNILSESFINTGLDLSKYYSINILKLENTKDITNNLISNLDLRKEFEDIICSTTDYYVYRDLISDYNKLYHSETNRSYFTEHDNYLKYLEDNCIDLYNLILPLSKKYDEAKLLKTFGILCEDLKQYLKIKRLVWDIPYKEFIIKYLYYMIDYFKSYTVQLEDFKIIFRFNNEKENRLFLFDNANVVQQYTLADLVGGELYENQNRPLSLHDNFYNHEKYIDDNSYRCIVSSIQSKDNIKLYDNINIITEINNMVTPNLAVIATIQNRLYFMNQPFDYRNGDSYPVTQLTMVN